MNKHSAREEVIEHTHWPFLWSWCYYAKVDKTSPPLIFPEAKQVFEPELGDLIIFPGYVTHGFAVDLGLDPFRFIHFNIQAGPKEVIKDV